MFGFRSNVQDVVNMRSRTELIRSTKGIEK